MDLEWQQSWCRKRVTFWSSCKNLVSLSGSSRTIDSSADIPCWSSNLRNSRECFRNSPKFLGCSTCCTMLSKPFNKSTADSHNFNLSPRLSTLTWPLREWISTSHSPRKSSGKLALWGERINKTYKIRINWFSYFLKLGKEVSALSFVFSMLHCLTSSVSSSVWLLAFDFFRNPLTSSSK